MTDIEKDFIEKIVNNILKDNKENLQKSLFENTDHSMTKDDVYSRMILNAISFSTRLSVLTTIELLLEFQVLKFDDSELPKLIQRLSLSVVKGSDDAS